MSPRAATIQIFLPGGDPRGIRVADMPSRVVQVIEVPRPLVRDFLSMEASKRLSVYFLLGEGEGDLQSRVYIGQTADLRKRIQKHNLKKDFWQRAFVVTSQTNSLTRTHTQFLEWMCIHRTQEASRYVLENGARVPRPHVLEPLEAECQEHFEAAHWLLSTLGFPVFDPVRSSAMDDEEEVFVLRSSDADGSGLYTTEGMVVLRGSSGRADLVPSVIGTSTGARRQSLIDAGVIAITRDRAVFAKDHLFKTPSGAACAVLGRTANGWIEWETKDGRTLDEVKRQPITPGPA